MKNFEQNFDRLLKNLKEAKDILAECNIEMQQALITGKGTITKYVIYNPFFDQYVKFYGGKVVLASLERATMFEDQCGPFEMLEECDCDINDFVVREIKCKVVNNGN